MNNTFQYIKARELAKVFVKFFAISSQGLLRIQTLINLCLQSKFLNHGNYTEINKLSIMKNLE